MASVNGDRARTPAASIEAACWAQRGWLTLKRQCHFCSLVVKMTRSSFVVRSRVS